MKFSIKTLLFAIAWVATSCVIGKFQLSLNPYESAITVLDFLRRSALCVALAYLVARSSPRLPFFVAFAATQLALRSRIRPVGYAIVDLCVPGPADFATSVVAGPVPLMTLDAISFLAGWAAQRGYVQRQTQTSVM